MRGSILTTRAEPRPALMRRQDRRLAAPRSMLWSAGVAVALVTAAASWLVGYRSEAPIENPLANARFTRLTDFPGAERDAAMSPDGKFVAFRSDRDGPFDVFVGQTGTGRFVNLTQGQRRRLALTCAQPGVFRRWV